MKDFGRINDHYIDINENYKQAMAKLKGVNTSFDKIDQTFANINFTTQNLTTEINEIKLKFEKLRKEKSEKEMIEKIQADFENIQKYTEFSIKDIKQKCIDLQEFLTHFTPLQTHLQVLEAFEFLDCLSSEAKLNLFKTHKSIMLKLNQSKKCSDYYFVNLKQQIISKIDEILSNTDKEIIDPKLKERMSGSDIDKAMQTDPYYAKFEGKTNFREVWLVRSAKEGMRYTKKWNRYYRYIKQEVKRKLKEKEETSDDFYSEESNEEEKEQQIYQEQLKLDEIEESVDSNSDHPESRKIEEIKTEITNKKSEHQEQSNYVEKSKPISLKDESKVQTPDIQESHKDKSESIHQKDFDDSGENPLKDEYLEAPINSNKEINFKRKESVSKENSFSKSPGEENIIKAKVNRK